MNQKTTVVAVLFTLLTSNALAHDPVTCLEKANTQKEINSCTDINFKRADAELNRTYAAIQKLYANDKVFLKQLKTAQLNWIKVRDADFTLKFPHAKESKYYGSSFPMCSDGYKTKLTLKRIAFLKEWLVGTQEGDVCKGSIKSLDSMSTPVPTEDTIKTVCYENVTPYGDGSKLKDVEELMLSINYGDGTVKGEYNYLPAERDKRYGEIDGSLWKGAIAAKYTFEQEGETDSTDISIQLKDNVAVITENKKDSHLGLDISIKQITCK